MRERIGMHAESDPQPENPSKKHGAGWSIGVGLLTGILCGVLFGEYCEALEPLGKAYVGLLQMTVLPYLAISLIAKIGRLDLRQAKRLGVAALVVLFALWLAGIGLVVLMSAMLPPVEGASFFSPDAAQPVVQEQSVLTSFIPVNVFRALSDEIVPAVVVFCLLFGIALIPISNKHELLDFLDLCGTGIGRINGLLIRLAPLGLFALSAAAAGTLRLDELERLQAYLIMFAVACVVAVFAVLPGLLSSVTRIRYWDFIRASAEPLLTAIAVGKLFVVLPQIIAKCEDLLNEQGDEAQPTTDKSVASVVVPLAYPFPHLGKVLVFVFVTFAAWYVGRPLTIGQDAAMASTGAISSFASPLVTVPYLLDEYQLPQDLISLFILPGFITMRLGDVVGVVHLMILTLLVNEILNGRLQLRWERFVIWLAATGVCLSVLIVAGRWYLAGTTPRYDLDVRLLSLEVNSPCKDVVVYRPEDEIPARGPINGSIMDQVRSKGVLRVGYRSDRLPYCFFNRQQQLVGLDVELMHRLAASLQVRLEFVPFAWDTLVEQLETDGIDVAIGGLIASPQLASQVGLTQPYATATASVVLHDHRRGEFVSWDQPNKASDRRLAVCHEELGALARLHLERDEIIAIDSHDSFFTDQHDHDGLLIAAEEGAAWNVLHPEYTVVVPRPIVRRPVCMVTRPDDDQWQRFLDRRLDLEELDGTLDRLRKFWVHGGGTQKRQPRWCVLRDVLGWIP
jgi:Na+/H+-dicarboxylate symporter